ncbi:SDR family NAD(P)-dependent oxidoreductase [Chelatococcus reniformis]|uniref:Beta-ketoacyl-ACP reductase n=1 Tax=Chelatococcus reniformis TaxID=1494448 RepID=A0A916XKS4_9HYPH|nr:SDR family NAD(P)-dependent oxidoreductase [Chelatococcus reniformis]GGC78077.1 beta-ketoacyl-ACP reductase [Chelatococcus reniformis]
MIDFGLRDRVIVVTGGASGIGRAHGLAAAKAGARVAVIDASHDAAHQTAEEIERLGGRAVAEVFDVRDGAAAEAATARIEEQLGPIDGVVASAGTSRPALATDMTDDEWSLVIDINLTGLYKSIRPIGRRMVERRRGAVVLIASIDAFGGHAARSHYSASKHGVAGLTKSLAIEWGRHNIRVNGLAPGVVDTPLLRASMPAEHIETAVLGRVPLGRLSTPDDQAGAGLFLLSDAAAYITGAVLPVDGGLTAGFFTNWNGADLGSRALLERGVYGKPASAAGA